MKEHIRKRKIMAVTLTGSLANFLLLVFKFVAGVLGHSSAMIADAVHSLSDFVTDVIVLLFINISSNCRHYLYFDKGNPVSSDAICRKKRK